MFYDVNGDDLCPYGQFLNLKKKCEACISGYCCPDGINIYECSNGSYSNRRSKECQLCGCDGCLKHDLINETTKRNNQVCRKLFK